MQISEAKKAAILKTEQFSATAYKDGMTNGVQNYSIGYGHQIQPTEQSLVRQTVTQAWGMAQFIKDLYPSESLINSLSRYALSQSRYDELVDFGYNAGTPALMKVLTDWNTSKGNASQIAAHIKLYVYTTVDGNKIVSSELVRRRAANAAPFNSGNTALVAGIAIAILGAGMLLS